MSARRVHVVGAGVVGLTVACELADAGHAVTVVADHDASEGVSAVAAAVWFPYRSGTSTAVLARAARSLERFVALAGDPTTGVDLREGIVVERRVDADRWWTPAVPGHREAADDELPRGAVAGVVAVAPVVTIAEYLPWLRARCAAAGVRFVRRRVLAVDELAGATDLVVVAAGLRSGALLGDNTLVPVRGQVVRLANPGLTAWLIDEEHPAGLTYVVPRRGDVVCGGTADVGAPDLEPDPATEAAILERATALVPALAGAPVLSRGVGLRPTRHEVRLERVDGFEVPLVACYGHGGAGVTLSWGCAEAVAALAADDDATP